MIYRNADGDLIEINKNSYINDVEYMRYVLGVNDINLDETFDKTRNTNTNTNSNTNSNTNCSTFIKTFLIENAIKNIDK